MLNEKRENPLVLSQGLSSGEPQLHVLEIAGNAIVGGMEKYVHNLVERLPEYNFKITCVTPYESLVTAGLRELGCEVYITPMDLDPPWRSIQFVTELIAHLGVDLVHAHLPRAHVLAGLAGKLSGRPVVATVHGMNLTAEELGISRTTGTHLTLVCRAAYAEALALGLPAERLTLIPNGVDTRFFSPGRGAAEARASFRKKLNIPAQAKLVGFIGRLAWEKGPDQFVQVAQYVHEHMPDVHFVFVGEGPLEEELRQQVEQAGLQDRLHFAGLWQETQHVFPAIDVFMQTSRIEGMPFALLEAMACGRPVVAMGVGGVPEIVEVGTTGVLSAQGDWKGLGEALMKLLRDEQMAKQMGLAGRKRVEEKFDLSASTQRMAGLFRQLISQNQSSGLAEQTGRNGPAGDGLAQGELSLDPTLPFFKQPAHKK